MRSSKPAIRTAMYAAAILVFGVAALRIVQVRADAKSDAPQMRVAEVQPRAMEDTTQKAVLRDYVAAWKAIGSAMAENSTMPLADNFTGFAREQLTQRIKDQRNAGLTTRIVDRGHRIDAIFYSRDGSAVELRDIAAIETQVLEGGTVVHSDTSRIEYLAILTSAADRWQVRLLQSVPDNESAATNQH
jgi:hypothetical protein